LSTRASAALEDSAVSDIALEKPFDNFDDQAAPATRVRGYWQSVFYRLRHDPVTLFFAAAVLLIVLAAIFASLIAPFDPYKDSVISRLKPFGWRGHWLGTDELGRDMLSRLIYGGRVSLLMGVVPVLVASLIGGLLGVIGGFAGGRVNTAIMRTMDVFYAFPSVLLAVAIAGAMGSGIGNGMLALTLVFIPPMCRVAETATTQVRALDYIEAARATGAGTIVIIRYHVLGNVLGPVFIYASSLVSVSILLASGLSFLGLGVRPPIADWGLMLSTLRQSIYVVPFVCALPGAAIFIASISFNLVSDGLRGAMDVRL
jgi:peptide/nickel transport system permease protein